MLFMTQPSPFLLGLLHFLHFFPSQGNAGFIDLPKDISSYDKAEDWSGSGFHLEGNQLISLDFKEDTNILLHWSQLVS